jgi:hypothetical protein
VKKLSVDGLDARDEIREVDGAQDSGEHADEDEHDHDEPQCTSYDGDSRSTGYADRQGASR